VPGVNLKRKQAIRRGAFPRSAKFTRRPGYTTEKIVIFKATHLGKVSSKPEEDEIITVSILSKKETHHFFKKGAIVEAKTISALAFCGWL